MEKTKNRFTITEEITLLSKSYKKCTQMKKSDKKAQHIVVNA